MEAAAERQNSLAFHYRSLYPVPHALTQKPSDDADNTRVIIGADYSFARAMATASATLARLLVSQVHEVDSNWNRQNDLYKKFCSTCTSLLA